MNRSVAHAEFSHAPSSGSGGEFRIENGQRFAGRHLLIDLWGGEHLDSMETVKAALRESVAAAGATLLRIDLHRFTPHGGISGVAILAESHMSIHTWPEEGYAALDIFLCGDCDPRCVVPVVQRCFGTVNTRVSEFKRGLTP